MDERNKENKEIKYIQVNAFRKYFLELYVCYKVQYSEYLN